jgi:hypothetical protein
MTNLLGVGALSRAVTLGLAMSFFSVSAQACPPIKGENVNMDHVAAYRGVAIQLGLGCPVSYKKEKKGKIESEEILYLAPEDAAGYVAAEMEIQDEDAPIKKSGKCPHGLLVNYYPVAKNPNALANRYAYRFAKDINMTEMSKADVVLAIDTRMKLKLGTWYVVKFMKVLKESACDGVALFRTHDSKNVTAITFMSNKSVDNDDVHEFIRINGIDFYY